MKKRKVPSATAERQRVLKSRASAKTIHFSDLMSMYPTSVTLLDVTGSVFSSGVPDLDQHLAPAKSNEQEVGQSRALVPLHGWPTGRLVEARGEEALLHVGLPALRSAQALGYVCALINGDNTLGLSDLESVGVRSDGLLVSKPDSLGQALDILVSLVGSCGVDLVLANRLDLLPVEETKYEGLQARFTSQALRRLTGAALRTGTCVMFITPNRVCSMGIDTSLKFYASIRVEVSRRDEDVVCTVLKNRLGVPFGKVIL